jgi:hypothetical protein
MITISIKETGKQAKNLIEYLKTLPYVIVHDDKKPNAVTLKAIKEVEEGKVTKSKNKQDFFEKLNK